MFDAAQMTMRRERPVEPRCARGCRGVTLVSGLPGSPAARCPARDRAPRRGSSRLPGSNRRRCHRRIEQHLPTGAIAQETYRKIYSDRIANSSGAFFFIWTLLALGVTALFSIVLSVPGLGQHFAMADRGAAQTRCPCMKAIQK